MIRSVSHISCSNRSASFSVSVESIEGNESCWMFVMSASSWIDVYKATKSCSDEIKLGSTLSGFQIDAGLMALSTNQIDVERNLANQNATWLASIWKPFSRWTKGKYFPCIFYSKITFFRFFICSIIICCCFKHFSSISSLSISSKKSPAKHFISIFMFSLISVDFKVSLCRKGILISPFSLF